MRGLPANQELDPDRHLLGSHAVHHRDLFFDFGDHQDIGKPLRHTRRCESAVRESAAAN
jgi:hypothetical protein